MSSLITKGNSSGTGSLTLESPNTNSDLTISLPAAAGTMMVSGNMPAFSAYLSSNQSITTSTRTKVQFNTEVFDTANCYDNTTNYRFTPTVAGYYQISACVNAGSTISQTRFIMMLYKNGDEFYRFQDSNGSIVYATSGSGLVYCNGTTDYLEVYCQVNGTSPSFSGNPLLTWFNGSLVRAE
jgi:hypothetical protein